jgi:hypothetical protein
MVNPRGDVMATYQINRNLNGGVNMQREAFVILASVVENATSPAYGFTVQDVSLDGAGRLRVRVSGTFPAAEIESFGGDIIVV